MTEEKSDPLATPPKLYPSVTRYSLGSVGLGISMGIVWTQAMTSPYVQRHITPAHAYAALYSLALLCLVSQAWMLYRWSKRMKHDQAELEKKWDELKLGPYPWRFKP